MPLNFAETVSAITFGNGVVRINFVNRDDSSQIASKNDNNASEVKLEHSTLIMPLPGFLYMASVINGLLNDPRMQAQVEKYVELGLLSGKAENSKTDLNNDPSTSSTKN